MEEVFAAALSYPAVIFTVLMGFVILFWTGIILSGVDPSSMDPDFHPDADVHVDADVDADAHSHVDVDAEAHGDGDAHHPDGGIASTIAAFMNIGTVPLSMVASAGVLAGWVLTMLMQLYIQPSLAGMMPAVAAGTVILALSGIGSMTFAGFATRPLRGVFKIHTFEGGAELIDQACMITSSKVTAEFGEARFEMKGAPLILSVRCRLPNKLSRGKQAVIVAFDEKTNIFEVGELNPDERSAALDVEAKDLMDKARTGGANARQREA